jgi:hypothetical protein
MDYFLTPPRLKVLSGLMTNLAAGWIGAVIIVPNFSRLPWRDSIQTLLLDVGLAIVSMYLAFRFEEDSTYA